MILSFAAKPIGTSNCTTGDKIELHPNKSVVLTIIPRDFLIPAC